MSIFKKRDLNAENERLRKERNALREERDRLEQWVPPGHYYSPIPSIPEIKAREKELFSNLPSFIPGVNLNEDRQLEVFETMKRHYPEVPFEAQKQDGLRYYFENPSFSYADAVFLFCFIREYQPTRIVEVGSGFSSGVILDTNDLHFDGRIECTFIDPYPSLLLSLMKQDDRERSEVRECPLQEVEIDTFTQLTAGDILFIDSTHVSKVGSDVNRIFFEILPALEQGVLVHFHDVLYPFEYPKEWIYLGKAWNEAYLLRAFLQYNEQFQIQFFNSYFGHFHKEKVLTEMPLCSKNSGGSIWIKKV